jgi:hypothetical protein
MRLLTWGLVLSAAALWACGCSSSSGPPADGGTDAGVDGGDGGVDGGDAGGDEQPVTGTPRKSVTAGSGTAQSAGHKLRLHVGAPQPYGKTEGAGHQLQSGPKPNP